MSDLRMRDRAQEKMKETGLRMRDEEKVVIYLRLPRSDKEALEEIFSRKRITLSAGVRMVLSEYIENNI